MITWHPTCCEEEVAKQELEKITPSNEKLKELAKKHPPPQKLLDLYLIFQKIYLK